MKAIVLLFTATLFVVYSAFPTVGGQQSNEFCTTLAYPQDAPAAYVHLCYTPGKGITRILNFVTIPDFLLVCTCVLSMCSPCKCNLLSRAGFASGSLFSGSYRIILKMSKFPTCNTWGTFKSPVPRVTHGKRISHLSLTCPMCNTWGTYKSDLNSQ